MGVEGAGKASEDAWLRVSKRAVKIEYCRPAHHHGFSIARAPQNVSVDQRTASLLQQFLGMLSPYMYPFLPCLRRSVFVQRQRLPGVRESPQIKPVIHYSRGRLHT